MPKQEITNLAGRYRREGSENRNQDSVSFLLAEYEFVNAKMSESEEVGNTRVNYFLTLTTAVLGGSGIANIVFAKSGTVGETNITLIVAFSALLAYGLITLARIIHRNKTTDEFKEKADRIRKYFLEKDPTIGPYLAFSPSNKKEPRTGKWKHPFTIGTGGLVQTVALLNSFIVVSLVGIPLSLLLPNPPVTALGLLALVGFASWTLQWYYAFVRFRGEESKKS